MTPNNNIITGTSSLKATYAKSHSDIRDSISVTVSDARVLGHAHDTNYSGNRPGCLQSLTRKCPTRARSAACTHIYVHDDCVHTCVYTYMGQLPLVLALRKRKLRL